MEMVDVTVLMHPRKALVMIGTRCVLTIQACHMAMYGATCVAIRWLHATQVTVLGTGVGNDQNANVLKIFNHIAHTKETDVCNWSCFTVRYKRQPTIHTFDTRDNKQCTRTNNEHVKQEPIPEGRSGVQWQTHRDVQPRNSTAQGTHALRKQTNCPSPATHGAKDIRAEI
jgi:hypothetical protein